MAFAGISAPFGVLNIAGSCFERRLGLPRLHLAVRVGACSGCRRCDRECPISLPVTTMVEVGTMDNAECLPCGRCAAVSQAGLSLPVWTLT